MNGKSRDLEMLQVYSRGTEPFQTLSVIGEQRTDDTTQTIQPIRITIEAAGHRISKNRGL